MQPSSAQAQREIWNCCLDRHLADVIDEVGDTPERGGDEDDWDFVEAGVDEERNGAKGTSLFARGVVDHIVGCVQEVNAIGQTTRTVSGMSNTPSMGDSATVDSPTHQRSSQGAVHLGDVPKAEQPFKRHLLRSRQASMSSKSRAH